MNRDINCRSVVTYEIKSKATPCPLTIEPDINCTIYIIKTKSVLRTLGFFIANYFCMIKKGYIYLELIQLIKQIHIV